MTVLRKSSEVLRDKHCVVVSDKILISGKAFILLSSSIDCNFRNYICSFQKVHCKFPEDYRKFA